MKAHRIFIFIFLLIVSFSTVAQSTSVQEPLVFANQQQQQRFDKLTQELRCLVCQNQNLADSDAPLAHDLRREVHQMLLAGRTNEQIKQFLVQRYGDFVLYRPPVQKNTYLLWLAPLILLLAGAWILRINIRKRSALLDADENEEPKA
jgi:cytochrome c-type biogenesis protein CcmH